MEQKEEVKFLQWFLSKNYADGIWLNEHSYNDLYEMKIEQFLSLYVLTTRILNESEMQTLFDFLYNNEITTSSKDFTQLLKIGYNKAGYMIDCLEHLEILSPYNGTHRTINRHKVANIGCNVLRIQINANEKVKPKRK